MGLIQVDCEGLAVLASCCQQQATVISGAGAAPPVGDGFGATAAAVAAVHGDLELVGQRVAGRLHATAAEAGSAAAGYANTDAGNAQAIGSVGTVEV